VQKEYEENMLKKIYGIIRMVMVTAAVLDGPLDRSGK